MTCQESDIIDDFNQKMEISSTVENEQTEEIFRPKFNKRENRKN